MPTDHLGFDNTYDDVPAWDLEWERELYYQRQDTIFKKQPETECENAERTRACDAGAPRHVVYLGPDGCRSSSRRLHTRETGKRHLLFTHWIDFIGLRTLPSICNYVFFWAGCCRHLSVTRSLSTLIVIILFFHLQLPTCSSDNKSFIKRRQGSE